MKIAAWSRAWLVVVCLAPAVVRGQAAGAAAAPKPNIVYIVADDLGWKDLGYHGSDIRTPNIDRLAASGARLEQFYVQPMCTPTRAALMTGRYPCRYGLQTAVILSSQTYGLPTDEWLLPQSLREAGYRTAMVGKWHLGHADPKYWPMQRGFDYHYGAVLGEIDYFTHAAHDVVDWYRDNKIVKEEGYVTQLLGKDAVRVVDGHDVSKPLFLYLAFTAPHAPYQAPREYVERFKRIEDPTRRTYAAMINCMDDEIGRVLDALDRRGMRQNTLVVFMSDNGGNLSAMLSGEGDVSKIKLPSDNGPYRNGKGSLYEGGTRVPAIVNWPGHVTSGAVDQMIHVVDMYPTLAALTGASTAKCKPLDGVDVWPTMSQGRPSPRKEIVYNVEPLRGALRQGDWKLIWRTPLPSALELYNVASDPSEKTNVAAEHPAEVAALRKRIEQIAGESAKSMFLSDTFHNYKTKPASPPALPSDDEFLGDEP